VTTLVCVQLLTGQCCGNSIIVRQTCIIVTLFLYCVAVDLEVVWPRALVYVWPGQVPTGSIVCPVNSLGHCWLTPTVCIVVLERLWLCQAWQWCDPRIVARPLWGEPVLLCIVDGGGCCDGAVSRRDEHDGVLLLWRGCNCSNCDEPNMCQYCSCCIKRIVQLLTTIVLNYYYLSNWPWLKKLLYCVLLLVDSTAIVW